MNSRVQVYGLLALLVAASAGGAAPASQPTSQPAWARYEVVVERNMFSRDRGAAAPRRTETTVRARPVPGRNIVLTGIALQGEEHVAFLEDTLTGTTAETRIGEAVLGGRLTKITLDSIDYEKDGDIVTVEIGQNLGRALSASMPASDLEETGESVEGAAAGDQGAAGVAEDANLNLLERLRQRRQRELGR